MAGSYSLDRRAWIWSTLDEGRSKWEQPNLVEDSPAPEVRQCRQPKTSGMRREGKNPTATVPQAALLLLQAQIHFLTLANANTHIKQKQDLSNKKKTKQNQPALSCLYNIYSALVVLLAVPSNPGITKHWLYIVDPHTWSMNSLAAFVPVNNAGPEHPAACAVPHQHASWHSFGLCQLLISQTSHTHHFGGGTGCGLSLPAPDHIHTGFEGGKKGKGKAWGEWMQARLWHSASGLENRPCTVLAV